MLILLAYSYAPLHAEHQGSGSNDIKRLLTEYGGTEKLKVVQVDIPEIDDDEALVKVHTAGLIWMERYWQLYEKDVKVGSNVPEGLEVGTKVMVLVTKAFSSKQSTDGGMPEYAKAHFSKMIPKPQSISYAEAALVLLSALTAW
ncbi:hypothetical protein TRIATDRAFT_84083 [Trichoderma atroviride IMI 206040]|uniref:Uncharacterized protein n=1 Tax=Hypocrea atroviridis (strain ATCC 20476 / IMI 206040) TaxID=452589 RepID=G9P5J7_HYPAI|nr:uncharacterized protein TRIATDRAFT_84083 [Trichoderma atroviride IMI 206040]EHK42165.1 hypothetical protein TRIATDRAFT_84083 [Trichoderma atroviride IMI 206040]